MSKKLLIIIANVNPDDAEQLTAPIFQATVAAATSHEVEVIFTGRSGVLAIHGKADKLLYNGETERTIYDLIKEAHKAGVVFKTCTPTLEIWGEGMISEIEEAISTANIITESLSDDTVVFTY